MVVEVTGIEPDVLTPIHVGDTGPIFKPRPSVLDDVTILDADWKCWIGARYKNDHSIAIIKREVTAKTADNLRFIAALHPVETETLIIATGLTYVDIVVTVEVINTTTIPPFNVEKRYNLAVYEQGIVQ